jgi:hypothetical protein
MNLIEVEEERLKHGRCCVCKATSIITTPLEAQKHDPLTSGSQDTPVFREKLNNLV